MQPSTKNEFSVEAQIRKSLELHKAWAEANEPENWEDLLIEGEYFRTPEPRRTKPGGGIPRIQWTGLCPPRRRSSGRHSGVPTRPRDAACPALHLHGTDPGTRPRR